MKETTQYEINIQGLEEKRYSLTYQCDDAFFVEMGQDLIKKGTFTANLELTKSATMIRLDFRINGFVELTCDRSLEEFREPVKTAGQVFLKFGERNEEITDEIEIIERGTEKINVAKYIYDFIALSLPAKKVHPNLRKDEDASPGEKLVYSSLPDNDEAVDPRWAGLEKLMKKK